MTMSCWYFPNASHTLLTLSDRVALGMKDTTTFMFWDGPSLPFMG